MRVEAMRRKVETSTQRHACRFNRIRPARTADLGLGISRMCLRLAEGIPIWASGERHDQQLRS
jgi:hypothetical protein